MQYTVKELSERVSDPEGRDFAVYYAINPKFVPDPSLTVSRLAQTHCRVMSIRIRDGNDGNMFMDKILLQRVFERMQCENWSPNGEAKEVIRALNLHHTSMSAGDVIYDRAKQIYHQIGILNFIRIPE